MVLTYSINNKKNTMKQHKIKEHAWIIKYKKNKTVFFLSPSSINDENNTLKEHKRTRNEKTTEKKLKEQDMYLRNKKWTRHFTFFLLNNQRK